MMRYCAGIFILIFVWQIVGVSFLIELPHFSYGLLETIEQTVATERIQQPVTARLSAQATAPKYDSLVMVGDVMLARNVEFLMNSKGSPYPFRGLDLTKFSPNPAVVANFEATIPEVHIPTPVQMLDFSVPTSALLALRDAGYTHFSLGNNHAFDFGVEGFESTKNVLTEHFTSFGTPDNDVFASIEMITIDGRRVALIAVHGLVAVSEETVRDLFLEAKRLRSEFEIVYVHWGEEYALRHHQGQERLAQTMISAGADLIIGHHPHVVQGVDLIDGVPVFYSLGNYIFDQYFSKDVQEGLVLVINLDNGLLVNLVPVTSKNSLSQPTLMTKEHHAEFLVSLANRSSDNLREQITSGTLDFQAPVASSEKVAIMQGAFQYVQ